MLVPFARTYAQALLALRAAKLSRIGRASVDVSEDPTAGRARLQVRRYPTLPWEPLGPEVELELAPALALAAEDMRDSWRREP
jgi:hypothetical protein